MLFHKDNLGIRALLEEDAPLLVKWLSNPKVLEYYEGRDRTHDLDLVVKHFYEERDEITQCIIVYEGQDIGYVQFYPISKEERELYGYTVDVVVYGMDQFIGETDLWNKGIGTTLVISVRDYIISQGVDIVVMDPQDWNQRALRCYEKSGFKKIKYLPEHEWHEGEKRDCWLIEYRVSKGNSIGT
ncbi:acetyltransferase [Paenibacillus sp. TRM 82003]|nr:acetyltransferase [Paenibacillus sp. TRM 82003]